MFLYQSTTISQEPLKSQQSPSQTLASLNNTLKEVNNEKASLMKEYKTVQKQIDDYNKNPSLRKKMDLDATNPLAKMEEQRDKKYVMIRQLDQRIDELEQAVSNHINEVDGGKKFVERVKKSDIFELEKMETKLLNELGELKDGKVKTHASNMLSNFTHSLVAGKNSSEKSNMREDALLTKLRYLQITMALMENAADAR